MPKRGREGQNAAARGKARRRLGSTAPRRMRKKKVGPGRAVVRATIMDLAEQKRYDWRYDHPSGLGNASWKIDPNVLSRIGTGNTNSTRIGDEIYVQYIEVSGFFQALADRPNTIIRAVSTFTDYTSIPTQAVGFAMRVTPANSWEWFSNALDEQQQRVMIDRIVEAKFGAQNCVTNEGTNDSRPLLVPFTFTIPVNRKIHFKDAQHISGTSALNIGYIATDARGGVLDNIGYVNTQCSIFFKDV